MQNATKYSRAQYNLDERNAIEAFNNEQITYDQFVELIQKYQEQYKRDNDGKAPTC